MKASIQNSNDKARRLGAIFLGPILIFIGLFFISSGRVYSINFLLSMVVGPFTIIEGFLLSYVAIFKWEILRDLKETKKEEHFKSPYLRILTGATIGFIVFAVPCAFFLYQGGWFHRVPCFTPPPGLVILNVGFIGVVIGALASMFSRKWKAQKKSPKRKKAYIRDGHKPFRQ